jgi:hypothetical protein
MPLRTTMSNGVVVEPPCCHAGPRATSVVMGPVPENQRPWSSCLKVPTCPLPFGGRNRDNSQRSRRLTKRGARVSTETWELQSRRFELFGAADYFA